MKSNLRGAMERPLSALAIVFAVAIFGNALLVGCGGNTQQEQTSETTTQGETGTVPADTAAGGSVAQGEELYKRHCVTCHGPNGKGDGVAAAGLNPKPRDHTDAAYMSSRTDEQLLQVIRDGKGQMPPWKAALNEEQMRAVLAYVRTLAGT